MNNQKPKSRHKQFAFRVNFSRLQNQVYGITSYKLKVIFIDSRLNLKQKLITLFHERNHEIAFKLFGFRKIRAKIDGLIDFVDFIATEYEIIHKEGYSILKTLKICLNRYR